MPPRVLAGILLWAGCAAPRCRARRGHRLRTGGGGGARHVRFRSPDDADSALNAVYAQARGELQAQATDGSCSRCARPNSSW
jgi:hypothetical protein